MGEECPLYWWHLSIVTLKYKVGTKQKLLSYSQLSCTFEKVVNDFKPITIFTKALSLMLD